VSAVLALLLYASIGVLLGNARTTPIGLGFLALALWQGVSW
jgi:hypothetical protein